MQQELKRLVDQFAFVSFDIFDTALLRTVLKPTDVFDLVEKCFIAAGGHLPFHYKTLRIESERKARDDAWRHGHRAEVTLDEIYQQIAKHAGVDERTIDDLKELEIDVEKKVCKRNQYLFSAYRYCLHNKKNVIFTSDTYLPVEVIVSILRNAGYDEWHRLYVSSSLGVTKSTGGLYEWLVNDLSCKPQEILHIGDNYDSDVIVAKRYSLATYFYEKCYDLARRRGDLECIFVGRSSISDHPIDASFYAATILNRFCSDRRISNDPARRDYWYIFGYTNVGILYFGFNSWLLENAIRDKVEKLYFLSRDGYIVKHVYDLLACFTEHAPPSEYLYASRRALNLPAIVELDDQVVKFLVSGTSALGVAQFLERMGLNPEAYAEAINKAGFSGKEDRVVTGHDYEKLRKLYALIADDIVKIAAIERTHLFEYFDSVGLFDSRNIGLVDIGWHGTLQHSINKMIKLSGHEIETKGYYLGTFPEAMELHKAGQIMNAYLCEYGQPKKYYDTIKLCVEIFEFIHMAPHGSVINFEKVNGTVAPVFEQNDFEFSKIEKARALQKGAFDFIVDLVSCWKHFKCLNISKELVVKPLRRVLSNPTHEEAVCLGDLEHAEGFGNVFVKRHIAKPPPLRESLINPFLLVQGYLQAFWKAGFRKRLFSISRIVDKL